MDERNRLQKELDGLSLFSIGRRKELKTQLAAITEEIEEALALKELDLRIAKLQQSS